LPKASVALMIIDPPYNLNKQFNAKAFKKMSVSDYQKWIDEWFTSLLKLLKPNASVYICSDPFSSTAVHLVLDKYMKVRNRITWEREKGRGASKNWKNNAEDIWFATMANDYTFNLDAVKLKRKVLAPYRENGKPKDWDESKNGNYRLTHPSNIWTDLTVPFWSMPENTDHPTQKPEKLIAKMILASSNENDLILDPFVGSGTTSVVAKKLNRRFVGIEIDEIYACLTEKRLEIAKTNCNIQGYFDSVFWERNTSKDQKKEIDLVKNEPGRKVSFHKISYGYN
jgi:site-specific DNA-methyltransferase (adenine-specific)